ncbi:MAG TPA: hypothetical protein VFD43_08595 [Planctomycetota bacterium]|nr:hypothetical protein [Planctomycetota bacterium]
MNALAALILERYGVLMSPAESAAYARLLLTRRATSGDTSPEAQALVTASPVNQRQYPEACADDPQVIALARDGIDAFAQRTAERLLRDYGDEIDVPRCPKCRTAYDPPTGTRCAKCAGEAAAGAAEAGASA